MRVYFLSERPYVTAAEYYTEEEVRLGQEMRRKEKEKSAIGSFSSFLVRFPRLSTTGEVEDPYCTR